MLDIIIIAVVAILCTYISKFFRIPLALAMLVAGAGLQVGGLTQVSDSLMFLLGTFCLVFATLDHSVQHPPHLTSMSLKVLLIHLGFLLVTVSAVLALLWYPVAMGVLLALVSLAVVPSATRTIHDLVLRDAKITSGILAIVLPAALLAGAEARIEIITSMIGIVAAVGIGLVVGILFFRIIRYSIAWERWLLFLAGMITYVIGSSFSSSAGIISVVALAMLSSKIHVPYKFVHTPRISRFVTGITYLLLGLFVPFSITTVLLGIILFVLSIFSVYASHITIRMKDKQRIINSLRSTPLLTGAATILAISTHVPTLSFVLAPAVVAFGLLFAMSMVTEKKGRVAV